MNPDQWLTRKRVRAHGLVIAMVVWACYAWLLATPTLRDRHGNLKGTDFLHFYTFGSLATAHRGGELYDVRAQSALAAQRVPDAKGITYLPLYPPQVSLLFVPLAHLSYGGALALWWLCIVLLYGACCYAIWRCCPSLREFGWTVVLIALAYPAFFHLIAWGQTSALALACFTAAFLCLRNRWEFAAGLALGCLTFKPQLGLAACIVLLITGRWRILGGGAITATGQMAGGLAYFGVDPYRAWLQEMWHLPALLPALEPRPYQSHNLLMFWSMLVPWKVVSLTLYAMSTAAVLILTVAIWRRHDSAEVKYPALLLATVLVAPHLIVYDLVILAPAILLLADRAISQPHANRGVGALLYLVYLLPFLGPYARWTHLQLSVVAIATLLYLIWRTAGKEPTAHAVYPEAVGTTAL